MNGQSDGSDTPRTQGRGLLTSQSTPSHTPTDFLDRFDQVRDLTNGRYMACCPSHDDRSPSLAIKYTGDRWLLHCHAGCDIQSVLDAPQFLVAYGYSKAAAFEFFAQRAKTDDVRAETTLKTSDEAFHDWWRK